MVLEDFEYYTALDPAWFVGHSKDPYIHGRIYITVKQGTLTDFATVPRIAWFIIPPWHPDYGKACVIHDHCYSHGLYNKEWADAVFLEGMVLLGCAPWRRALMFWMVTTFGRGKYQ